MMRGLLRLISPPGQWGKKGGVTTVRRSGEDKSLSFLAQTDVKLLAHSTDMAGA